MARGFNHVTLVGNLTRDPETRAFPSGDEFCRFSIAANYSYRTPDGDNKDGVDYIDVMATGGLASIVQTYCHKGKQILVHGKLRSSSWEQDGQTRSKLEVRATDIILLGSRSEMPASEAEAPMAQNPRGASSNKTAGKAATSGEDYELEAINYDQDGVNPEDIPF